MLVDPKCWKNVGVSSCGHNCDGTGHGYSHLHTHILPGMFRHSQSRFCTDQGLMVVDHFKEGSSPPISEADVAGRWISITVTITCDKSRDSRDLRWYSASTSPNALGWAQPQGRTPLTFHAMHPPSTLPSWLGLKGRYGPRGFSAISVSSPALNQAYQRQISSPELFVLTQIRCKEQPSLSSPTARSLTQTHAQRFPWPNRRFRSGHSKAEERRTSCLCNEEENGRFFRFEHYSPHYKIILPWGIGTTLGHSWCKYLPPALPSVAQITWKKIKLFKIQPACRQMQVYTSVFFIKVLVGQTKLYYYCTITYFTCSGIKFYYHFSHPHYVQVTAH